MREYMDIYGEPPNKAARSDKGGKGDKGDGK
jgi:hypothetical protein